MKKILSILFLFCLAPAILSGQQLNADRTAGTRVSDALAMLPAQNAVNLEYAMKDLVASGAEGMDLLTGMFDNVNNVPVNYALNGLAFYVTKDGMESARQIFERGVLTALGRERDDQVRNFYISLLAHAGTDMSVPQLAGLVTDSRMSGPALRALSSIDSPVAKEAVRTAVLEGKADKAELAYAAGDAEVTGVSEVLAGWLTGADDDLKKAVYYGLAGTGGHSALAAAARAEGYADTRTQATAQYLRALRAQASAQPAAAAKEAEALMKTAAKAKNTDLRLNAFDIYATAGGKDMGKMVIKAMDDPNRAYRAAVLDIVRPYIDRAMYDNLLAKADKTKNNSVKADILYFSQTLGELNRPDAVTKYISSPDDEVAVAAIWALRAGSDNGLTATLLPVLGSNRSNAVIDAAKQALLSAGWDETPLATVEQTYNGAGSYGKAAILGIAGAKALTDYSPIVFAATADNDQAVSAAAYNALAKVSSQGDLDRLFGMLDGAGAGNVPHIQRAVLSSTAGMDNSARTRLIRSKMDATSGKKSSYYGLLAATGDPAALEMITSAYASEDGQGKAEIINALSAWDGEEAIEALYGIASSGKLTNAFQAYIKKVAGSGLTPERKLLLLTKAMDIAQDHTVKAQILTQAGKLPLFQTMVFAGGYLDDADAGVRDRAAQAVMDVALANSQWYGPVVTDLLTRASSALNNADAGYQREGIAKHLADLPGEGGWVPLFNGKDLTGWKGLVKNPIERAKMKPAELARLQAKADELMREEWIVRDGALVFEGKAYDNICTEKQYADFEMYVDWMLYPDGPDADGGIYLRGSPQVQMWDIARTKVGAQVGSGGLYNNKVHQSDPLVVADNPLGEWNTFYIRMKGERVTVYLNGDLVVDNVVLENYWDRSQPIFPMEQIELQAHGTRVGYRNIYINELPMAEPYKVSDEERADGFVELFDGLTLDNWYGNTKDYVAEDGAIVLYPSKGSGGNLYTKEEYGNFVLRFEFMLTPGANNGIGIRTPDKGDAAYVGMEIQVLDDDAPIYSKLKHYQYHGSVYGVIAAKRGYLKPLGEWNVQEIYANGNHIRVTLNGEVIVDGDIAEASKNGTIDGKNHPGLLNKSGHLAFLGHGSKVWFRNLRVKRLD